MDDSYSSGQDQESEEGAVQEEEIEVDGSGTKEDLSISSVGYSFGGLLENGTGTIVDGYTAVNRGLNRFVQPKYWAALLFAAHEQKMPWITTSVPQKIMCNSVFVIDLKAIGPEQSILKDGLGAWIQNCGKVTNYFVWEYDNATEVKPGSHPDAVEFIRRIDKSGSLPAFTRVIIQAPQLELAAVQYFFKGTHEQTFVINNHRPKKSITNSSMIHNLSCGSAETRNRSRRVLKSGDREVSEAIQILIDSPGPSAKRPRPPSVSQSYTTEVIDTTQQFNSINSMSTALTDMATLLRNFLNEERKLRREDCENRRRERAEDRVLQREEIEIRKQELAMQRTRVQLDQQKWEIERKEKELFLDLLAKKL